MKRITVLGNFSGRNAGDNAILGNLMDDISSVYPDVEYLVPTLKASYVRNAFSRHKVRAFGLMPWNGALKIFGIPTFRAMLGTDLVLITDNLLFDRSYFNPAFNYLSTIALIAPMCRKRGIPVVLYNASVGPIRTPRGARALQRVLSAGPMAILRDQGSADLIASLELDAPEIVSGADCALNTAPPGEARIEEILREVGADPASEKLLGFNVNSYIDTWKKDGGGIRRPEFVQLVASTLDEVIEELDVAPVFFVTQVMDRGILQEVEQAMRHRGRVRTVANPDYSYDEMAGVMSRLGLVVAMRTHALILSCAVGTPIVNINAYPKSTAFLDTLDMNDWTVEIGDLSAERLRTLMLDAWRQRATTRETLMPAVAREQAKARAIVPRIGRILGL